MLFTHVYTFNILVGTVLRQFVHSRFRRRNPMTSKRKRKRNQPDARVISLLDSPQITSQLPEYGAQQYKNMFDSMLLGQYLQASAKEDIESDVIQRTRNLLDQRKNMPGTLS